MWIGLIAADGPVEIGEFGSKGLRCREWTVESEMMDYLSTSKKLLVVRIRIFESAFINGPQLRFIGSY